MNYENSKLSVTISLYFKFRPVQDFTKIVYKDIILFPIQRNVKLAI